MRLRLIACSIGALSLVLSGCSSTRTFSPKTVEHTLSHRNTGSGKVPAISASHGDTVLFHVIDTNDACFTYNAEEDTTPRAEANRRGKTAVDLLPIKHDEATTSYRIRVRKRAGCTDADGLDEVEWEVPVRELWNLAFAGGAGRHDLVDPRYFLKEESRDVDNNPQTPAVAGFVVTRNPDADDDFKVEGTALSHLYLSSTLVRGVSVAPLSFGISIDRDRPSYLLGSSFRFGSRAFLTIGRIFGTRQRLPTALAEGDFTDDANALADLPTRAAESWFVGVSFSFLSSGVADLFRSRVGVPQGPKPAPQPGGTTANTPPAPTAPEIKLDPTAASNPTEKITITGSGFSAPESGNQLLIGGSSFASTNDAVIKSWSDAKIEFVVPEAKFQDAPHTEVIEVKVGSTSRGKKDLTIAKKPTPVSINVAPTTVTAANATITITGTGFGTRPANGNLVIRNESVGTMTIPAANQIAIKSWTDTKIEFVLPAAFAPGAAELPLTVQVQVGGATKGEGQLKVAKQS